MTAEDGNEPERAAMRRRDFMAAAGLAAAGGLASRLVAAADEAPATRLPADNKTTVLITGANRGLGIEFVRQYAPRGWRIIATCREPAKADALNALAAANADILVEQLDVADHQNVDALAAKYQGQPIDVLLNNAGIGGGMENQMFGRLRYEVFHEVMQVNAIGPLKMAEAFIQNVAASPTKKLITVSSSQGSIASVDMGMLYWYRSSKAALNMIMRNLALALKRRGVIVGLVTPGATDTDFMKGVKIPLRKPEVAAADMIRHIDAFTLETTGQFINYDGKIVPW
jgi:NAD(P)-dependent dehydrogenase (short-subunit alcohol dehydrogenase family)